MGKYTGSTATVCSGDCHRVRCDAPACIPCPPGMTTAGTSSGAIWQCVCPKGHIKLAGWETAGCTACPLGKFTDPSRDHIQAQYGLALECYGCPSGTTTLSVGTEGFGAYSQPLGTNVCLCPAGKYFNPNARSSWSTACYTCPSSTYKNVSGNALSLCISCPTGKSSRDLDHILRLSIEECQCNCFDDLRGLPDPLGFLWASDSCGV